MVYVQIAFSLLAALGWILLMKNSDKIRESKYWFIGWFGSLLLVVIAYPGIALAIDFLSKQLQSVMS